MTEAINKTMREHAIKELESCQIPGDPEEQHEEADKVLCDLLVSLGYKDVVDEWNKVFKWYA